jgi:heterotetrameric sarcosine oxidase delta subunit
MLYIRCPWCGWRDESEFGYGGEAHIERPHDPASVSDAEWADYLFFTSNTRGDFRERWVHTAGCRRWFNAVRDTVTYEFKAFYRMGERPPGGEQ